MDGRAAPRSWRDEHTQALQTMWMHIDPCRRIFDACTFDGFVDAMYWLSRRKRPWKYQPLEHDEQEEEAEE